jgi:hypothetical protein
MLSAILRRLTRVPFKIHGSILNSMPHVKAYSQFEVSLIIIGIAAGSTFDFVSLPKATKRFLPPAGARGVESLFQHGIELQAWVWALNWAHLLVGEVCTGLPQGALAIVVPFCYISSVCAVLA